MIEFEGFVVRVTPFRENDVMINAISRDGFRSFLAKGVLKFESKNAPSVSQFVKSRFCLFKGKDGYFLRQGTLIEAYSELKENLTGLSVIDFISEVTNLLVHAEDAIKVYPLFEKIAEVLKEGFDPFSAALIYLAQVLKYIGYGIEVDKYSICGKISPLVDVSYKNGGFICSDCLNSLNGSGEIMPRKMKILRYIFRVDIEHIGEVSFEKNECVNLLKELTSFTINVAETELKSVKLLTKI